MQNKIRQIGNHLLYVLWSNVIYGLIVYHVFILLARHSLLYAYLGNLVLIILGLLIDAYTIKMLQSKKFIQQLKEEKGAEKNYRVVKRIIDNFVSFKTALYMFYVFILIFSQIIVFDPTLVGENISNFILANNYSILFLIAFDMLIKQFSEDKRKMKAISEKFQKSLTEKDE